MARFVLSRVGDGLTTVRRTQLVAPRSDTKFTASNCGSLIRRGQNESKLRWRLRVAELTIVNDGSKDLSQQDQH